MSDLREAAEMALRQLQRDDVYLGHRSKTRADAIEALRQALDKPEIEPQALVDMAVLAEREACANVADIALLGAERSLSERVVRAIRARGEKPPVKTYAGGKPNYCTPNVDAINISQKPVDETAKGEHKWVGLTDEEIKKIAKKHKWHEGNVEPHLMPVFRSLEAKLREKNG